MAFGAENRCNNAIKILSRGYELCCIVDNDSTKGGKVIEGIEVVDIEALNSKVFEVIVIAPVEYKDIVNQLVEIGITNLYLYDEHTLIRKVWQQSRQYIEV